MDDPRRRCADPLLAERTDALDVFRARDGVELRVELGHVDMLGERLCWKVAAAKLGGDRCLGDVNVESESWSSDCASSESAALLPSWLFVDIGAEPAAAARANGASGEAMADCGESKGG